MKGRFLGLYSKLNLGIRRILNTMGVALALFQIFYAIEMAGYLFRNGIVGLVQLSFLIIIPQLMYWGFVFLILWIVGGFNEKKAM